MTALLEVEKLEVGFGATSAVRGASLAVQPGETHCLVGESGCGKSVTALAVMNLLARGARRSAERLVFQGEDLTALDVFARFANIDTVGNFGNADFPPGMAFHRPAFIGIGLHGDHISAIRFSRARESVLQALN